VCTLSFRGDASGYELLFSRDERRARPRAEAPVERRVRGVRYLAPRDPEGGGAWLAANEHGVALALLNRYDAERPVDGPLASRGTLVLAHADARDPDEVEARLRALPLACFAPFDLAVLAPGRPPLRLGWNGRTLEIERGVRGPLASSAVAAYEAREWRRRRAGYLRGEAFHRDHVAPRPELATCMHRADAETVSLSRVRVTPDHVAFAYAPGAPCRTPFASEQVLRRG
jgi:hypothetical protein